MRTLFTLIILGALIYVGATVQLGKHTFFGHIRAIWHTEEAQDLKNGVEDTAGPAVHKVERGIKAGVNAMESKDAPATIDAGVTQPTPAPAPAH